MVTKQELVKGYETEIKYQRHMLENLGRWFSLLFIIASIDVYKGQLQMLGSFSWSTKGLFQQIRGFRDLRIPSKDMGHMLSLIHI